MKIKLLLILLVLFSLISNVFLILWYTEKTNNSNLKKEIINDSLTHVEDIKIINEVSCINLILRGYIDKHPSAEKDLLKDSIYVNMAAKYN